MNIENKSFLITGASSGIGEVLAYHLAKEAGTLILVARRLEKLEQIKKKILTSHPHCKVLVFGKDISIRQNQIDILSALKRENVEIDILINNAGLGDEGVFYKSDWEKNEQLIDVNVKSVVSFTHLVLPTMVKSPLNKAIVFIGSGAGIAWMPSNLVYSGSKHFISATAMILRAELKPRGIKVFLVAPGPVDTEFDKIAGVKGGMKGGPSQSMRISAIECAEDIVKGIKRNRYLIFPGKKYNRLMKMFLLLPWKVRRWMLDKEAKKLQQGLL
jgi:short-subunit dehydrogenase